MIKIIMKYKPKYYKDKSINQYMAGRTLFTTERFQSIK
jgi:hypothetical protein